MWEKGVAQGDSKCNIKFKMCMCGGGGVFFFNCSGRYPPPPHKKKKKSFSPLLRGTFENGIALMHNLYSKQLSTNYIVAFWFYVLLGIVRSEY